MNDERNEGNPTTQPGAEPREEAHGNVYPVSGELPEKDMPTRTPAEMGQGMPGAAGYGDSGESELTPPGQSGDELPERR